MKYASGSNGERLVLPHKAFDEGRTTGVKGVIADARSYEAAKRSKSISTNANGNRIHKRGESEGMLDDELDGLDSEDEEFMERWREERRVEMQREGNDIRNRRTEPSVRRFGRFDEVDALGYLDAIEKVGKEVTVVVFIYDVDVRAPSPCILLFLLTKFLVPGIPSHRIGHHAAGGGASGNSLHQGTL